MVLEVLKARGVHCDVDLKLVQTVNQRHATSKPGPNAGPDDAFGAALWQAKQAFFSFMRDHGLSVPRIAQIQLREYNEQPRTLKTPPYQASWEVSNALLARARRAELLPLQNAVRGIVAAHDFVEARRLYAGKTGQLPMPKPGEAVVRLGWLNEFLLNAHTFLRVILVEYERRQTHGIETGGIQDFDATGAVKPTPDRSAARVSPSRFAGSGTGGGGAAAGSPSGAALRTPPRSATASAPSRSTAGKTPPARVTTAGVARPGATPTRSSAGAVGGRPGATPPAATRRPLGR
jgi:hypothetical protein